MKKLILIILILIFTIPFTIFGGVYKTREEWVIVYIKECKKNDLPGVQCIDKTKSILKRLLVHKRMILRTLERYKLGGWLGTIPFVESGFKSEAVSSAGAVCIWQIMPINLVYYLTEKEEKKSEYFGWKRTKVTIKEPTLKKAISLGKKPEICTEVAAKLLVDLYKHYRNHENKDKLVVMAYNAGALRVDCSLGIGNKKKCEKRKLWKKPLTPETLNYYPKLLAIRDILNGYNEYFTD